MYYSMYLIVFILLMFLELIYFKVANKFNIIDKPNERSSHSMITLRGGGVIFYFAILIFFIWSNYQYPWFFLGLTLMTIISFLDDIFTLSNKIRLLVHFISVILMGYQLNIFEMPWYYLGILFVLVVGVINAYNFMDGINGITGFYSLVILLLQYFVNRDNPFISNDLLVFSIISLLIFSFFNFRKIAKCFAGDVGSVSIAYIILFILGTLILKSGNLLYILFLSVYGIDTVWTIIERLKRKENIFEAHRTHLYQYLANEAGINKLFVSFTYGTLQLLVGLLVIKFQFSSLIYQITVFIIVILVLSIVYFLLKNKIRKTYIRA